MVSKVQVLAFGVGLVLAMGLWAPAAGAEEAVGDPYTLSTCPISGGALGGHGEPVVKVYDGREVRFCCAGCEKPFEEKKAENFAKIDEQLIAQQKANYPLTTCVVRGTEIEGEGVAFVVGNRMVKTCCKGCKGKVEAEPAKFIAELDKAVIEKQKASYSAKTCPVSGKELTDSAVNMVVGNELVRLCCAGCEGKVKAEPTKYLQTAKAGDGKPAASRADER